ncbi:MAG: SH3 domain-containing protein, partial [Oscillospiraceae bacterium]|nr:SH3 domain-containing protein [Oscillospiraceae bacterium]
GSSGNQGSSGNEGGTGNEGGSGNVPGAGPDIIPGSALYTGRVILTNALNVRQEPTTRSANVGTLARNASVTIYEVCVSEYMAWGRCDLGWICLTYVDLVPASGNGAVDARVVQYEGLNIREAPGTANKSVGTYSKGVVVDIYEFSGNWGRTDKGWVSLDYLLT